MFSFWYDILCVICLIHLRLFVDVVVVIAADEMKFISFNFNIHFQIVDVVVVVTRGVFKIVDTGSGIDHCLYFAHLLHIPMQVTTACWFFHSH